MYVIVQSVEAGVQEIDQYYRDLILSIAPPCERISLKTLTHALKERWSLLRQPGETFLLSSDKQGAAMPHRLFAIFIHHAVVDPKANCALIRALQSFGSIRNLSSKTSLVGSS